MFGFEGLKRRFTAPRKTARRQSNTRALLRVEQLEDRLVPSGFTDGDFEGLPLNPVPGQPQDLIPSGWTDGPPGTSGSNLVVTNFVDAANGLHDHGNTGGNYMRYQGLAPFDCLYQDFATVPNQQYTVSFWGALVGNGGPNVALDPVWDENGAHQDHMGASDHTTYWYESPSSSRGTTNYQLFTFTETASNTGTTRIDFHGMDANGGTSSILLDDVSVVPVTSASPPNVTTQASATLNAAGTLADLSVGANDPKGETLTYTWNVTSGPSGATTTFTNNGSNSGTGTSATFSQAGNYTLQVTIQNTDGLSATSNVSFAVTQVATSVAVSPANQTLTELATQQYTATVLDQFNAPMASQPTSFNWTATSGNISNGGLYTAPSTSGSATIKADAGSGLSGSTSVTVSPAKPPTITVAASGTVDFSGLTAKLSVTATDPQGQALSYSWSVTSAPSGAAAPSFSGGGSASTTTATFSQAGSYTFQVTVTNTSNLVTTSSIIVVVSQLATSVVVSPASPSLLVNDQQQFTAKVLDQFGAVLASQPTINWSASSGGISNGGLYTAPPTQPSGGSATITATIAGTPGVFGTTSVSVTDVTFPSQPPSNVPVALGQSASFAATAAGTGPITLVWEKYIPATWTWLVVDNTNAPGFQITTNGNSSTLSFASVVAADAGTYYLSATNEGGEVDSKNAVLTIVSPPPITPPPASPANPSPTPAPPVPSPAPSVPTITPPPAIFATGTDAGGAPQVEVYDATTGTLEAAFFAFPTTFGGGVRVAVGDVNGDGIPDIICGAGPGGGPEVRVFDGRTFQMIRDILALPAQFTGGVFVAAGDVNNDGFADIIVSADQGGGPQVSIFSGKAGSLLTSFFATTPTFTGGIRVAAADLYGTGFADVIAVAGPGGGPQVTIFDGRTMSVVNAFYGMTPTFTGGLYVAAGDLDGNGKANIVVGAGPGGAPQVSVFDGATLAQRSSFLALPPTFNGGVRVAVTESKGAASIVASAGPSGGPEVTVFDSSTLAALESFFATTPTFNGGVFVG
jgi:hypothetical protein